MMRLCFGLIAAVTLAACGSTNVGQACTTTDDCETGLTCYSGQPGGYCSKGCSEPGSDKECPGGSICASNGGSVVCSQTCTDKSECRENYECNGVTGTNTKVCAPK